MLLLYLYMKEILIQLANILIFLKAGADRCSKGHNSSGYTLGLVNNNTFHPRESKIKRIGELYFCYSDRKIVLHPPHRSSSDHRSCVQLKDNHIWDWDMEAVEYIKRYICP